MISPRHPRLTLEILQYNESRDIAFIYFHRKGTARVTVCRKTTIHPFLLPLRKGDLGDSDRGVVEVNQPLIEQFTPILAPASMLSPIRPIHPAAQSNPHILSTVISQRYSPKDDRFYCGGRSLNGGGGVRLSFTGCNGSEEGGQYAVV